MPTDPSTAEKPEDHPGPALLAALDPDVAPPHVSSVTEPTAGMVLHRVLAMAARTFLLNDLGGELLDESQRYATVDALTLRLGTRPLWAQSAAEALDGTQRRHTEVERIHQSRVALRRIRSNLRTFRLALDPKWGTALRAECSWYADLLGGARDLHIIRDVVTKNGPAVIGQEDVLQLEAVVSERTAAVLADIRSERGKPRRFSLTEQMMVLWDGPEFKPKAERPASEVMPRMLKRTWHDLRGSARVARKNPIDVNLHQLRIRLKDMRYGCETVALVEGGPAQKTAKACEHMTGRLGDLHDADYSIDWLEALAGDRPDLADPIAALVAFQREVAARCRKGWKKDLKEVERRWRSWQRK
ncbi:MAG: CHAD domain-containing protein [Acidimicrobiales bacterium]|nr:CHAD domain-containing protein [Acidimicrobiales bacterium]